MEAVANKVQSIIESYKGQQGLLISLLQDIQAECGYLPKEVLIEISTELDIPASRVYSVATFFKAFSLKPRGEHVITVCLGTACHVRGGAKILQKLERDLGVKDGETTEDLKFTLESARCLGACALGPLVVVDDKYEGQVTPEKLDRLLKKYE